ncbi:unnamed protein product [Peronospora destructor]|uniref:Mitochondrial carrier protein n=1 Tax=Peronospora destructor TaxID=86335 RepID=A0AAV0V682_9STRA|nr:unnamed protein product [Peronospora destructor]
MTATVSTHAPKWDARQLKQMAAGGGAGIVAKSVIAPFERVKIVCQTGESVGTIRSFWTSEGVLGGNMAACVRVVPHKGVLFAFSDFYKDVFCISPFWRSFIAGSLRHQLPTYPLDLIRTRVSGQIGDKLMYTGIVHTFMRTLKEEGARALFRGIGPTLFGALPYEGIKFGSYDVLKGLLLDDNDPEVNFVLKILCGGGAGVMATVFTYPNDTVRRRLQMQGAGGTTRQYQNAWDCYVTLAKNEGWTVYYRGLTPTLVRAVPNMGVQFAIHDVLKSFIE